MLFCLFVSNKRQNGWTDRAQILCGTSFMSPVKVNDWSKFQISLLTKFNFHKIFKIHETFVWNLRTFFVIVLQCTQRENVYNCHRVWVQSALKAIYSNLIFKLSSPETESETALQWSTSFFFSFITYSCFSLKSWVGTDYWSQSWPVREITAKIPDVNHCISSIVFTTTEVY